MSTRLFVRLAAASVVATLTIHPTAAFADIDGTPGDDVIDVPAAVDNVNGGDGDDTITVGAIVGNVNGDAGNDDISVDAIVGDVNGGGDDDTIVVNDIVGSVDGGDGDDTIVVDDIVGSVSGGDGDDDITVNSIVGTIDGGDGNDLLCVEDVSLVTLVGGAGSDLVCPTDDAVTVDPGVGSTLDLAANDRQLSDELTETTAPIYALVGTLPSGIVAAIDAATGVLTFTARQSCTLTYSVSREIASAPGTFLIDFADIEITVRGSQGRCTPIVPAAAGRDDDTTDTPTLTAVLPDTGAGDHLRLILGGGLAAVAAGVALLVAARPRRRAQVA